MGTKVVSEYSVDKVESALLQRILSGRYQAGELLPAFEVLMEEFGVSYSTMSKALGRLRARRLVAAEPGEGMRVCSLSDVATLELLLPMLEYAHEPWRRWSLLSQFFALWRVLLADWVDRAALARTDDQLEWFNHYTNVLETRVEHKRLRAEIGMAEYELMRIFAAAGGNSCFQMLVNPMEALFSSDALVQGQDVLLPPETYRAIHAALKARDGKKACELVDAALWARESVCVDQLHQLGWTAHGAPLRAPPPEGEEAA